MRPSLRDSEGALHERGDLLLEDGDDLLGELLAHVRGGGLSCRGGTYSVVPGAGSWGPLADPWQCPVQRYTCPGVPGRVRTSRRCDGATTRGPPPTAPK